MCSLNAAIRRMMLPDDISVPSIDNASTGPPPIQAHNVLSALEDGLQESTMGVDSPIEGSRGSDLALHVSKRDVNNALKALSRTADVISVEKMLSSMLKNNIPFQSSSLIDVMRMYNSAKSYDKCIRMFDQLEVYGKPHPNPFAWGCLIEAKTENGLGDVDQGIKLLKHLEKNKVVLLAEMYNPIINGLVKKNRHDEAFEKWTDMKIRGVNANVESYNIMIEQCEYQRTPERAFFLMDEMKLLDLKPSKKTFCKLIRACASAPMWVNGYEDIVFDALAMMEGQELIPDVEVYNALLFAFTKIGDGDAAAFYLEEMKKKGLQPDVNSYNHVLASYARFDSFLLNKVKFVCVINFFYQFSNQLVGAKRYGQLGRYVRPEPPPDTERQALYKDAGFDMVNEECKLLCQ